MIAAVILDLIGPPSASAITGPNLPAASARRPVLDGAGPGPARAAPPGKTEETGFTAQRSAASNQLNLNPEPSL